MSFNCADINTFKSDLDNNITVVQNLNINSHATIKIQSLLNITIYALATRFLEGCIKHLIYNCAIMRGDTKAQLDNLEKKLKNINNPNYINIKDKFLEHLSFDITNGLKTGRFTNRDINQLNEIVLNRHRNVHTTNDPSDWFSKNVKDVISDFPKEYPGLIKVLEYLDSIIFDKTTGAFIDY
jgi:hypothetical protein